MSLPKTFIVRLRADTEVIDQGGALIGGSPTRYVRLSSAAQRCLVDREVSAATPVGAALAEKLVDLAMADPIVERLPTFDGTYTIVTPVRDRADSLDRLLASVRAATSGKKIRIIVVDDASEKPAQVQAVTRTHDAEFFALEKNVGPAGARNAGLAQVTTEFVVFLDSDLVINDSTIPVLLTHFADPRVAVAAPRVRAKSHDGGWIAQYEDTHNSLDLGGTAGAVRPRSTLSWVSSAALVARVSALAEGFDADMRIGEDVDLVWRLSKAGWRIRYEPAAIVEHEHRVQFRSWFKRKLDYGTGAVPLAARHPENIPPAILAPWGVGILVSLLLQRRWSVPVALTIAAFTAGKSARQLSSAQHPLTLGIELTIKGIESATAQGSALMLRHWWPLTFIGCFFSRRIRRATIAVALADVAVDYVRSGTKLDPVRFGLAKRLDDIAYGSGVWLASLRAGTFADLKPELTRVKKTAPAAKAHKN